MQSVTVLFSLFGFLSCYVVNHEQVDDPDHGLSAPDEDLAVRHIVAAEFIEDNITLVLHHRDGQKIVASLEDDDDCIYSGYMMGCTTSSALVTGCKGSLQSVQIQSKVFGDMVFTTQDGVVMPLESLRYRRSADPDIDYDSDDTLDNPEFEDQFSDLASAEADDLPPPPPKLELNLNVYLDKNWGLEFGRIGSLTSAKSIMRHASLLWAHDSLNTRIDLVYDSANFFISSEHLLPSKRVYMHELPQQLNGPANTPKGDPTAHLYLTAGGKSLLLGLSQINGMCGVSGQKPRSIVFFKNDEIRTAMTVAHELGHLLGIEHDFILGRRSQKCGPGKTGGVFVMNYGNGRQKFSDCSNKDFSMYYNRVVLEKEQFCLKEGVVGCNCNGLTDALGLGGKCQEGLNGPWCYINKNAGCADITKYNGRFVSSSPCQAKPCQCNGKTDFLGQGGSCQAAPSGAWCYVDEDTGCDNKESYNGNHISVSPCLDRHPQSTTQRPSRRTTTQRPARRTLTGRPSKQRTAQPPVASSSMSSGPCDYKCKPRGSCTVQYTGPIRSGQTSGSCFPKSFGGSCSGTPPECQPCNEALFCPE